ncbi:methyltransferase FkbM family, partial [Rhizobium sp. PDO1-076]|uniref:FkbM family methyltransferase n=1 Tax=Rhizobium sp. PDO1-076 TaxID=1125979 RepID=UPI00024E3431
HRELRTAHCGDEPVGENCKSMTDISGWRLSLAFPPLSLRCPLYISSRHPTVSTVSSRFIEGVNRLPAFRNVKWDDEIRVPMTTIDRYGRPAFCKIDVEGAESDILRGLSQRIG